MLLPPPIALITIHHPCPWLCTHQIPFMSMKNPLVSVQQEVVARFSLELFHRIGLYHTAADAAAKKSIVAGTPKDIAGLVGILFEHEGSAFIFCLLLRLGFFNTIARMENEEERNLVSRGWCGVA